MHMWVADECGVSLCVLIIFLIFIYFMCMGVVSMHICAPCGCSACGDQERAPDSLEL